MVYKFTLLSDESDKFLRVIEIDSEATFFDFHKAILKACGYKDNQMTSFFICDSGWNKETEITLEEMDEDSEVDSFIMRDTKLSQFCEEKKQRLLYEFDPLAGRDFFIELTNILYKKDIKEPVCSLSEGDSPEQMRDPDFMSSNDNEDDSFNDINEYDDEELDGLTITDGIPFSDDDLH